MIKKGALLILLLFFIVTGVNAAKDGLDNKTLEKVKSGTVFIEAGGCSGSGFLIQKNKDYGYIATNAHVVGENTYLDVSFYSGTNKEISLRGEVILKDENTDLAVIEVKKANLPEPLKILSSNKNLKLTTKVYIVGFPLGIYLANTPAGNPTVTIANGIISNTEKDKSGYLKRIIINGDMNPGNSGGPIVDKEGNVNGITVESTAAQQMGKAIPSEQLCDFLKVALVGCELSVPIWKNKKFEIEAKYILRKEFADIREVKFIILPKENCPASFKSLGSAYNFAPLASDKNVYTSLAKTKDGFSGLTYLNAPEPKDTICMYQYMIITGKGEVFYSYPQEYYIIPRKAITPGKAVGLPEKSYGYDIYKFDIPQPWSLKTAMSPDGSYLYILVTGHDPCLRKIRIKDFMVEKVKVPEKVEYHSIAVSDAGLLAAYQKSTADGYGYKNVLSIIDENTLEITTSIQTQHNIDLVVPVPGRKMAFALDRSELSLVDLAAGKVLRKFAAGKDLKISRIQDAAMSPDGLYFYCSVQTISSNEQHTINKYKLSSNNLEFVASTPAFEYNSRDVEPLSISSDGEYVAARFGNVSIYKTSNMNEVAATISVPKNYESGILFDPQHKLIYEGSMICGMDGSFIKKILPDARTIAKALSPDGRYLFFTKTGSDFYFIDLKSGNQSIAAAPKEKKESSGGWLGNNTQKKSFAKNTITRNGTTITVLDIPVGNELKSICWSKGGESFYTAYEDGRISKISFDKLTEEKSVKLGIKIWDMHLAKSGLVVSCPGEQSFLLLDENDLTLKTRISALGNWNNASAATLDKVFSLRDRKFLSIYDLTGKQKVITIDKYYPVDDKGQRTGPECPLFFENIFCDTEGRYLFAVTSSSLVKFKIKDSGLELAESVNNRGRLWNAMGSSGFISLFSEKYSSEPDNCKTFRDCNLSLPVFKSDIVPFAVDDRHNLYYAPVAQQLNAYDLDGNIAKQGLLPVSSTVRSIMLHPGNGQLLVKTDAQMLKIDLQDTKGGKAFPEIAETVWKPENIFVKELDLKGAAVSIYKLGQDSGNTVDLGQKYVLPANDGKGFYVYNMNSKMIRHISEDGRIGVSAIVPNMQEHGTPKLMSCGKYLLFVSRNIYVFDAKTLALKNEISHKNDWDFRCASSPAIELIVYASSNSISIIDPASGKDVFKKTITKILPKSQYPGTQAVKYQVNGFNKLKISKNGKWLAATSGCFTGIYEFRKTALVPKFYFNGEDIIDIFDDFAVFLKNDRSVVEKTEQILNIYSLKRPGKEVYSIKLPPLPRHCLGLQICDIDPVKKVIRIGYSPIPIQEYIISTCDFKAKEIGKVIFPDVNPDMGSLQIDGNTGIMTYRIPNDPLGTVAGIIRFTTQNTSKER